MLREIAVGYTSRPRRGADQVGGRSARSKTYVDRVIPSDKQRLIADRYLLTDLVGRGGMGAVRHAEHSVA